MQRGMLPHPLSLIARLLVASAALLWLGHYLQRPLTELMIPMLRPIVSFVGSDFTILGMEVTQQGPNETLSVRADFSHPVFVSQQLLFPMAEKGWMQLNLTLGGLMQYSLCLLIIAFAWPASNLFEKLTRIALSLPLALLLLLTSATSTILAELWFPVHHDLDPHSVWPLLVWSKFLMGGGGPVMALLLAAATIAAAKRRTVKYLDIKNGLCAAVAIMP